MRLCFGTFAKVLCLCSRDIPAAAFVAKIAKCVDPESSYIENENRHKDVWEIKGDGPAVNKLLHCKKDFVINGGVSVEQPDTAAVIILLSEHIVPSIQEDKKAAALLALLDIIRKDESLDVDRNELFQEYFGMDKQQLLQQQEITFVDFISRILLFTTFGDRNNTAGKECVQLITAEYVSGIVRNYENEYIWNRSEQALSLTYISIFSLLTQVLESCQLVYFIDKVDPTDTMKDVWIEKCEEFLEMMQSGVETIPAPNKKNVQGFTLKKVQEFCQVLDNYTDYLGYNMRLIDADSEYFMPLHRDENTKWSYDFWTKVQAYRKQLFNIRKEICTHMPFASSDYQ